jgi:hypothetical protein
MALLRLFLLATTAVVSTHGSHLRGEPNVTANITANTTDNTTANTTAEEQPADPPMDVAALKAKVQGSEVFQQRVQALCQKAPSDSQEACASKTADTLFCQLLQRSKPDQVSQAGCEAPPAFVQVAAAQSPEDDLAQEMTHDLEMNFNKIAPFGKEDTARELQDHAAKTQDTLVDADENAEVAEIKRAVFRALTRLRAATIKEFDTIARLETQAIDAYNDAHHYRAENPLAHLHEDEAPVETDKLKSFH